MLKEETPVLLEDYSFAKISSIKNKRQRSKCRTESGRSFPYIYIDGKQFVKFSSSKSCIWCGGPFIKHSEKFDKSREHMVPKKYKSPSEQICEYGIFHTVAAHQCCNSRRGNDITWIPYYESKDNMTVIQQEWIAKMHELLASERNG